MKVFNIRLNFMRILSIIVVILASIFVVLAIISFSNLILAHNRIEITNENYVQVLIDSYDNMEKYVGKNITVTGYVYRLEDFANNEFVIARDMLVDSTHSQVIGFLCNYNQISQYETNSWVKINGVIEIGHYFGEIPIIRVKSIRKVTTPDEIFVTEISFGDGV